jgi:uncharacterized protein YodC (DUF2158 family)
VLVFVFQLYISNVSGQNNGCSARNCNSCLALNCVWFPVSSNNQELKECSDSCSAISDAPCYDAKLYNETDDIICSYVSIDAPNWTICSIQSDCSSCISTMQSDGVSPCLWYNEGNFCGSGLCTFVGCGSTTCDDTVPVPPKTAAPTTCNLDATTCEECLIESVKGVDVATTCAWVINQCVESCDVVPDLPCYSTAVYPEFASSPKDICSIEAMATIDDDLCRAGTECTNCTELIQTDGMTTCLWFERSDSDVDPYCGARNSNLSIAQVDTNGCDLNGICGTSDCTTINSPMAFPTESPMNNDSNNEKGPTMKPPTRSSNNATNDKTTSASMGHFIMDWTCILSVIVVTIMS